MSQDTTYNGWANYETWNVAVWIGNDESLYRLVRSSYNYETARNRIEGSEYGPHTPDGVSWHDAALDIDELDAMIDEL